MPQYFFDLSGCEVDHEGAELRTLDCARRQAVVAAGDHLRDLGHCASDPVDEGRWSINVRDQAGTVLIHLHYSISADTPARTEVVCPAEP